MVLASAILIFCSASLSQTLKPVEVTTTNTVDLGPGGTIRIVGSKGELNVEAWDRPEVEVTVSRYNEREDKYQEKTKKSLAKIDVETKKTGPNEVTITTGKTPKFAVTDLDYRIRAPKDAKLIIRHGGGDVVVTGMGGGIDAHAKTAEIYVFLPAPQNYTIDAKSRLGTVYSDFDGTRKHILILGNSFEGKVDGGAKAVTLVTDNGGISVQKSE